MLLLLAAIAPASAGEPVWFHPGQGDEIAVIEDGAIDGLPVARTGRLLARTTDAAALEALPSIASVEVLGGPGDVVLLHPVEGVDEVALSRSLRTRDDVAWSHPDLVLPLVPTVLPDDPLVEDQWHLANTGQSGGTPGADIDAESAWALSTGADQLIAVIDSGVDPDHPDLDVVVGYDYIDGDADSSPSSDSSAPHGTACAGLAAAVGDNSTGVAGVAYDASVYGIRLIGGSTTTSDLYDTVVEAVDAGATVLSNSWSFGEDCSSFVLSGTLSDALDYAETQGRGGLGAAVVVSAGNGNCDISGDGWQAYDTVVSVAASNHQDRREGYSSYGAHVDITGPAGGVLTTDISGDAGYGSFDGDSDYWGGFSGTSAAAPVVSGVFALMFAANPRLSAAEARQVLCETAVRIDPTGAYAGGTTYDDAGWNTYYGCGRVDAGAAVLAVANEEPLAPTLLGPVEEAVVDRVLLRWEDAVDGDGDWLSYQVGLTIGDGDESLAQVEGTTLDLTDQVEVGDTVQWWVQAVDQWGPGAASELASFTVSDLPAEPEVEAPAEQPGGCTSAPAAGGLVLALLGLVRRRRSARPGRSG